VKGLAAARVSWLNAEALIAPIIGCAVFLFHAVHVSAVARGAIFQKSNLAFDFDINRFVALWCTSPFPESENEAYYAVRHPLAVSLRLICTPLVGVGMDATVAACGIAAICAGLSTTLIYRIARVLDVQPALACAFAILWALSATTLVLGVLPEAYGLALVALTYQFLMTARWVTNHPASVVARIGAAVANFGITVTNVVLSGLSELFCRMDREPLQKALRGSVGFGIAVGIVAVVLSAISLTVWPSQGIDSPTNAAKQLYWSANAYEAGERQGVANVAWEFAATSFVVPAMAKYPSGVPENPYLWDFRGQNYSLVGWAAVLGWLGLFVYGAAQAAKDKARWPIWAVAAAWIAINIVLHTYWQFRGSIFVYTGHSHPAFLVLALAGASKERNTHMYLALVVLVSLLMAWNNLPGYLALPELN
jgi:hypothetical protein